MADLGRARDLHDDLTTSLTDGSGRDRTAVVLVQTTRQPGVHEQTVAALLAVPGCETYDLGGRELAAVGLAGCERRVRRALRPLRQPGVRFGVAWWPADGDDPALLLDVAAQRVGRRAGRTGVRRVGTAAAVVALLSAIPSVASGGPARPTDVEAGRARTVVALGPPERPASRLPVLVAPDPGTAAPGPAPAGPVVPASVAVPPPAPAPRAYGAPTGRPATAAPPQARRAHRAPAPKPDSRPAPKPESRPAPKPEPRPAPEPPPEHRPEPAPGQGPEPAPQPQPSPEPQPSSPPPPAGPDRKAEKEERKEERREERDERREPAQPEPRQPPASIR